MNATQNNPTSDVVLQVNNLQFQWAANLPVVLDINRLVINAGSHVFIRGASGTGKTTLLNILGGIIAPSAGSVQILDQDIFAIDSAKRDLFRANHIGFIFQVFNLIPYLSLIENIALPCRFSPLRQQRLDEKGVSQEDEAKRLLDALELDFNYFKNRPVSQLSIGQQQRVAAARALIGAPEIIIADEPTSALDHDVRTRFIELLFSEAKSSGATVIFVSHDPTLEQLFDKKIELAEINSAALSNTSQSKQPSVKHRLKAIPGSRP